MLQKTTVNYIVTGGSGFIGLHLLERLLQVANVGHIYVLDIKPPSVKSPKIIFKYCDIRQPISVKLDYECAVCFHLAALCKEPGFKWDEYFVTNHLGTLNVCDFLNRTGTETVVFTSTMMVFRAGEERMEETSLTAPDTAYGISKLLAELELKRWSEQEGRTRKLKIVRPGVVFGRGENGNFTRMYYALRRGLFAFVGRKTTIKGCVYVKDLVSCLMFLVDDAAAGMTYNLVLPETTTTEYICKSFFDVFGFNSLTPTIPYYLALGLGVLGEILRRCGIRTALHHRHMQKLFYSTNLSPEQLLRDGFRFTYTLKEALADWRVDCLPRDLY